MDKLAAMNAFAKVVLSGSYAEAARRLGLTRSAVSKAVNELEQSLGVRLLDRTTRHVMPTEAGLAYYERTLAILAQVEETENQISCLHDAPRGLLKINAPVSFGMLYLGSAVADFMALYGDLKVELSLNDRFIDPIEEGVDITVRIGAMADSSLIVRRIAPARMAVVASNEYLAKYGTPKTPADLRDHRCLSYSHSVSMQRWQLTQDGQPISVPIGACLSSNNGHILRDMALKGIGIARVPTFIVGGDIKTGRLQMILPDNRPEDLTVQALYAPNRYLAAKTRVFIDFLAKRFGNAPDWDNFPTNCP